jgi:hypothetical protein
VLCQCSIGENLDEAGRVLGSLFALFTARFKKSQAGGSQAAMLCRRLLQFLPTMLEFQLPNTQFVIDCHNYIARVVATKRGDDRAFFNEVRQLIKNLPPILASRIVMNFPPQMLEDVQLIPSEDTDPAEGTHVRHTETKLETTETEAREGDDVVDVVIRTFSHRSGR